MGLHRLSSVTIGVPDVEATLAYYREFGLARDDGGWLSTLDGGRQLRVVRAPTRRLVSVSIGADDEDDLGRIASALGAIGVPSTVDGRGLRATEPVTGARVEVEVSPRIAAPVVGPTPDNGPGRPDRGTGRAPAVLREGPVRPRKLGHVVIGSVDQAATQRFFAEGIGLKVSDEVPGLASFMRCSTDHHNVLVTSAPVTFLHHTSWQVDDVDEIGRGATRMLEDHPERHVWGLGRHHIGSNFFWYLRDPAGTFSEYYSDMDCVVDDALWKPEVWDEAKSLYSWGPPPPPSFVEPEDLAALMTGSHRAS
ncbi:VOC family protein [Streptomyces radicis]|uniref:Dioxygenase n=1 Tax=Streptomyces radicis TaxID=1750517 RepID=A0A3A9VUQ1_9ACTN|nr:VOC family protein [Streptomyces radicis]RKN04242.1 dioxygenase [Streptomyces radicis]RKN14760.1 dioxygenase [Streptomyces radicis]